MPSRMLWLPRYCKGCPVAVDSGLLGRMCVAAERIHQAKCLPALVAVLMI